MGGQYLHSRRNCPSHTGHNNPEHTREGNSGYFILVSGTQESTLRAFPGMHNFVHHLKKKEEDIGEHFDELGIFSHILSAIWA